MQASRQWFLRSNEVVTSSHFKVNVVDQISRPVGVRLLFGTVCYDILLACNDVGILYETKHMLSKASEMKNLDEGSLCLLLKFVDIRLLVYWDFLRRPTLIMYLKWLNMDGCSPGDTLIVKEGKFSKSYCT